ncbi:protein FAR1-RELATED SEQUENCE 5-like [Bidens hawaiensis]|uniref:protein FAR1-RELATED SEQUENCE 5-like n=1 Tax=Bidens hawaiensis TaxID=980011 RepID=UPI0040497D27
MEFTKKRRKIGYSERNFIHKLCLNKIGPNIAHNLQCSLKGGSYNINGTKTDFQNATRDLCLFISDRNAQMIVDTMTSRSVNLPNFSFEYKVVGSELRYKFWADDVSKCNYDAFGEVLGFDVTYSTNKYGMIFVPFTGVDHHKKCVTFGAPKLVLTDQDAAVKQAVRDVFDQSIHRLCMWHIVKKIPLKWILLIDDLNLSDHRWLTEIFAIREQWVPCYFREIQWCCLMKTTSICESSNSLFKVNTSHANTLVQFLLCFGTALDRQRKTQLELDFETSTTTPKTPEKLPLEIHASNIYTRKIFLEAQKEIYRGMRQCYITSSSEIDGIKKFNIAHTNKRFKVVNDYVVDINAYDTTISCSCMGFTRVGYLCRHAFSVLRYNEVNATKEAAAAAAAALADAAVAKSTPDHSVNHYATRSKRVAST